MKILSKWQNFAQSGHTGYNAYEQSPKLLGRTRQTENVQSRKSVEVPRLRQSSKMYIIRHCIPTDIQLYFKKWAIPGLFFISVFSLQLTVNNIQKNFADDGIQTADLWSTFVKYWKKKKSVFSSLQFSDEIQFDRIGFFVVETKFGNWYSLPN